MHGAIGMIHNIKRLPTLLDDIDLDRTKRILTERAPDAEDLADVEDDLYQLAGELEWMAEEIRRFTSKELQTLIHMADKAEPRSR